MCKGMCKDASSTSAANPESIDLLIVLKNPLPITCHLSHMAFLTGRRSALHQEAAKVCGSAAWDPYLTGRHSCSADDACDTRRARHVVAPRRGAVDGLSSGSVLV